jgi:hypothetical protein
MMRIVSAFAFLFALMWASARAETYQMSYEAVVLGVVTLGEAEYQVTDTPTTYTVRAGLRTAGLARMFDQTEITATASGAHAGQALSWTSYSLDHSYGRKSRQTQLQRTGRTVSSQIAPRYGNMGAPPASSAQQAQSFDPLSAVFALGRQVGAARECRGTVLVFDGRQHYQLSLTHRANGAYNGGGYNGPAVNCHFRYTPIAGFSANFDRSQTPLAQAWFAMPAEAGFAAPLQIIVPTPVGEAQLNLRAYRRAP